MADAAPREQASARVFPFTGAPGIGVRISYGRRQYHVVGWLSSNPAFAAPASQAPPREEVRPTPQQWHSRYLWASQRTATHVFVERVSDRATRLVELGDYTVTGVGTLSAAAVDRLTVRAAKLAGSNYS